MCRALGQGDGERRGGGEVGLGKARMNAVFVPSSENTTTQERIQL